MPTANHVLIDGIYYAPNHKVAIAHRERMAGLHDTQREHRTLPALGSRPKKHPGRKRSVDIVIAIVSYRSRRIDEDNFIAGAKPLRDAIARSLGVDDADPRLTWEYRVVITKGATGTHVLIQAK